MSILVDFSVSNGNVSISITPVNIYCKDGSFPLEVREQFDEIEFDYFLIETTSDTDIHKQFTNRFYSYTDNGAFHHRMGALVYKGKKIYTCGPVKECHKILKSIHEDTENFVIMKEHFRYCDFARAGIIHFTPHISFGNGIKFLCLLVSSYISYT